MRYHWIMTLSWVTLDGSEVSSTVSGEAVLAATTRRDAYASVMAEARKMAAVPEDASAPVLFYSLEPDELP